jgi:hypothetical protein
MTIRAGARLDSTDFALPDVVTGYGNGENTITATMFAVLPVTTCTASIKNPHPTATMLTLVTFGAEITAGSSIFTRICPDVSGSLTLAAGVGGGGPIGWGEVPGSGSSSRLHFSASYTLELPVSANDAVFSMHAYRDSASGTQKVDYPSIRLIPLRFVF